MTSSGVSSRTVGSGSVFPGLWALPHPVTPMGQRLEIHMVSLFEMLSSTDKLLRGSSVSVAI